MSGDGGCAGERQWSAAAAAALQYAADVVALTDVTRHERVYAAGVTVVARVAEVAAECTELVVETLIDDLTTLDMPYGHEVRRGMRKGMEVVYAALK